MLSFLPRETRFFDLASEMTDWILKAAEEIDAMMRTLPEGAGRCHAIKDYEHKGDEISHRTMELLRQTFITPIDRNDIMELISRLDDILDLIDAAGRRINLYKIEHAPKHAEGLTRVICEAAAQLKVGVGALRDIKRSDDVIAKCVVEINRLENEADEILRTALGELFENATDAITVIKHKEIYELLEDVTDRCEHVANVLEGLSLEYA